MIEIMETRSKAKEKFTADTDAIMGLLSLAPAILELKSKPEVNARLEPLHTDEYTRLQIWTDDSMRHIPKKILCFDADDTMIDYAATNKAQKFIFFHEEKLRAKIKYARENDIGLAIVTSRIFEQDKSIKLSVLALAQILGLENFAWIYYTNHQDKSPALTNLWYEYYRWDPDFQNEIVLVEDLDEFLAECVKEGFRVIRAEGKDRQGKYLDHAQAFMDGKPFPEVKFEDSPLLPNRFPAPDEKKEGRKRVKR